MYALKKQAQEVVDTLQESFRQIDAYIKTLPDETDDERMETLTLIRGRVGAAADNDETYLSLDGDLISDLNFFTLAKALLLSDDLDVALDTKVIDIVNNAYTVADELRIECDNRGF